MAAGERVVCLGPAATEVVSWKELSSGWRSPDGPWSIEPQLTETSLACQNVSIGAQKTSGGSLS